MTITYTLSEFEPTDKQVKITFLNEEGLVHERHINIPHLEDGSVDETYLQEIIEGQLRGVENKIRVNAITFIEPVESTPIELTETETAEPVEPTEEETSESLNDSKDLISEP
jgi:hypothetical protein